MEDGVSGFLAPERDAEALTRHILQLAEQSNRWPEMGREGRRRVERDYELERLNDELDVLLRDVSASAKRKT